MSLDTTSLAEPMATILDTFAGVNAIRKLEVDTFRDDLVDILEAHADHVDDDGHVWIRVDVAADLVADLPQFGLNPLSGPTEGNAR